MFFRCNQETKILMMSILLLSYDNWQLQNSLHQFHLTKWIAQSFRRQRKKWAKYHFLHGIMFPLPNASKLTSKSFTFPFPALWNKSSNYLDQIPRFWIENLASQEPYDEAIETFAFSTASICFQCIPGINKSRRWNGHVCLLSFSSAPLKCG